MSDATREATVPYYHDGACLFDSHLVQLAPAWMPPEHVAIAAERAYREAFLAGAREAAAWDFPDVEVIEAAYQARWRAREASKANVDEGRVLYRVGHEVEAARTRGRHHALEFVAQAWERFCDQGWPDERIAREIIAPWLPRVEQWAAGDIEPTRAAMPPRPDDDWPAPRWAETQPPQPRSTANLAWLYERNGKPSPPSEPPARSLRELIFQFPHLRPPVIHGLLRQGETMNVIAPSKTGKSWLVLDLALAVASGRPWLDTFATEPGKVLIIDNELHAETSAHRLPKVMEARGLKLDELGQRVFAANLRGRLQDLLGLGGYFAALEPDQYRLIILDAFYRFLPRDTDENDNGTMAMLYNHLDAYAARLGCAFVLVHHSTKGNQSGKAITDVGAGAGAQSRATDTHLILRPHEEDGVVVLDAAVRSWPPIQPRCLRWTFPVWTVDDTLDPADLRSERPRRRPQPEAVEAKPVEPTWDASRFAAAFVSATPAPTLAILEAAMKAGLSERRATRLLKQAERNGLIHRWRFGATHPVQFATVPQAEAES